MLLLLGCPLIPSDRLDVTVLANETGRPDSGNCPPPLIQRIDPPWGSGAGGTEVLLEGPGLGQISAVRFDGDDGEIVEQDENTVRVLTPATPSGEVQVEVLGPCGQDGGTWQAFPDATGRGSAIGHFEWNEYIGAYWAEDVNNFGRASFAFTEPFDGHYWDTYANADDTCINGGTDWSTAEAYPAEVDLSVSMTNTPMRLPWSDNDAQWVGEFGATQWAFNVPVLMDIVPSGPLTGLELDRLARTPTRFQVTEPEMRGSIPTYVDRDDLTFQWDTVTADRIVIELGYAADQQNVSESVSCVALNDGEFTVDGSLFQQTWSYEALIFTRVSAVREGGSTVPLNNGESRVTAAHTVFGILFTNAE